MQILQNINFTVNQNYCFLFSQKTSVWFLILKLVCWTVGLLVMAVHISLNVIIVTICNIQIFLLFVISQFFK